jgi:hypothetical protein
MREEEGDERVEEGDFMYPSLPKFGKSPTLDHRYSDEEYEDDQLTQGGRLHNTNKSSNSGMNFTDFSKSRQKDEMLDDFEAEIRIQKKLEKLKSKQN